ncbi:hypothetical protein [Streptomyces sp. CBMA156]|uniref:hypothetical protein n=1 Tax=Streptomyces sp. CBMA156 TaxID=1930280 RepID=UPI001661B7C2|nr:hypothetical protein [Streptomyces sp. CBMA156]MBD0673910.1 hypothetical protein [Streptomyces sp. CBMA156]
MSIQTGTRATGETLKQGGEGTVNEEIKDRLRQHSGKIRLGSSGALLALSVFTLVSGLLSDGPAARDTQSDALVQRLEGNLGDAKTTLATQHAALLAQLPGMDIEKVNRDWATGRSLPLSLTGSSASTRTVKEQQVLLDARYGFLDHESRALTEFVPEWMTATGAAKGAGTTYTLAALDIGVNRVQGLNYSYTRWPGSIRSALERISTTPPRASSRSSPTPLPTMAR